MQKTNNKKGTYLQIYESYYDPERKAGAHRSYRPIGYVHELQATGIEDPISFFKDEVQKLNQEFRNKKQSEKYRQISEESPEKFLGYFPLKNLNDSLGCKKYIGSEYEKVIEIFNHQVSQKYPFDISHTYFDCTNFYFEIDREDDFRLP